MFFRSCLTAAAVSALVASALGSLPSARSRQGREEDEPPSAGHYQPPPRPPAARFDEYDFVASFPSQDSFWLAPGSDELDDPVLRCEGFLAEAGPGATQTAQHLPFTRIERVRIRGPPKFENRVVNRRTRSGRGISPLGRSLLFFERPPATFFSRPAHLSARIMSAC